MQGYGGMIIYDRSASFAPRPWALNRFDHTHGTLLMQQNGTNLGAMAPMAGRG
jgi:hypothetical protein